MSYKLIKNNNNNNNDISGNKRKFYSVFIVFNLNYIIFGVWIANLNLI